MILYILDDLRSRFPLLIFIIETSDLSMSFRIEILEECLGVCSTVVNPLLTPFRFLISVSLGLRLQVTLAVDIVACVDRKVIHHVCHRNHHRVGERPAKTSRASKVVHQVEILLSVAAKNLRVLSEDLVDHAPLKLDFVLIGRCVSYDLNVL